MGPRAAASRFCGTRGPAVIGWAAGNLTGGTIAMTLFKTFSLTWWQAGLFKTGMLATGIAIGSYWSALFAGYLAVLVIVAALCLSYVTLVWARQQDR